MTQKVNPLNQYFRKPAIYLPLPSRGRHWPVGSLNMPVNGELPIMPMTAMDEITYRTPDALFNGQAVVDVIQSCVPNIVDAWQCPAPDLDALLVAIRIASYGHNMDLPSTCPSCETVSDYVLDLRSVLDQLNCPDFDTPLVLGDLTIHFRPVTYQVQNQTSQRQFEDQQLVKVIPGMDLPDAEKVQRMREVLKRITDLTFVAVTQNISHVQTPQVIVDEAEHVEDFLRNCDRKTFDMIRDHVISLKQPTEIKPVGITCSHCSHEYQQPVTLNMTNFFAPAS